MRTEAFEAYGPSHLVVLAIFAVGAVAAILLGHRLKSGTRPARIFAVVVVAAVVPLHALQFTASRWDVDKSLPLQLCDLLWIPVLVGLWNASHVAATVAYLWGSTLSLQAVLTPDLGSDFPAEGFLTFWATHVVSLWGAAWLVGSGPRPTWRTYRLTAAITAAWAGSVFVLNSLIGTNYGFVNHKPARASILDLLGPWPVYVFIEIGLILLVWAVLTWPFARRPYLEAPKREG